jgi:hypothetical protein
MVLVPVGGRPWIDERGKRITENNWIPIYGPLTNTSSRYGQNIPRSTWNTNVWDKNLSNTPVLKTSNNLEYLESNGYNEPIEFYTFPFDLTPYSKLQFDTEWYLEDSDGGSTSCEVYGGYMKRDSRIDGAYTGLPDDLDGDGFHEGEYSNTGGTQSGGDISGGSFDTRTFDISNVSGNYRIFMGSDSYDTAARLYVSYIGFQE